MRGAFVPEHAQAGEPLGGQEGQHQRQVHQVNGEQAPRTRGSARRGRGGPAPQHQDGPGHGGDAEQAHRVERHRSARGQRESAAPTAAQRGAGAGRGDPSLRRGERLAHRRVRRAPVQRALRRRACEDGRRGGASELRSSGMRAPLAHGSMYTRVAAPVRRAFDLDRLEITLSMYVTLAHAPAGRLVDLLLECMGASGFSPRWRAPSARGSTRARRRRSSVCALRAVLSLARQAAAARGRLGGSLVRGCAAVGRARRGAVVMVDLTPSTRHGVVPSSRPWRCCARGAGGRR